MDSCHEASGAAGGRVWNSSTLEDNLDMQPSQLPIVQGDAAQSEERLLEMQRQYGVVNRRCGECTACCTFMVVTELKKPAKVPCPNCSAAGCAIYESRPLTCRGW